jgi:hypothetical protein
MFRLTICTVPFIALAGTGCASQRPIDTCEADISPEGYDLVLRTVPGARVDYRIGKDVKTLRTVTGVERIGSSADEVEIIRCVRSGPKE